MAECRSCGAPIRWELTKNGKRIPLDPDPVANGNLAIREVDGEMRVVSSLSGSDELYVSHFATCPDADTHRRAR